MASSHHLAVACALLALVAVFCALPDAAQGHKIVYSGPSRYNGGRRGSYVYDRYHVDDHHRDYHPRREYYDDYDRYSRNRYGSSRKRYYDRKYDSYGRKKYYSYQ